MASCTCCCSIIFHFVCSVTRAGEFQAQANRIKVNSFKRNNKSTSKRFPSCTSSGQRNPILRRSKKSLKVFRKLRSKRKSQLEVLNDDAAQHRALATVIEVATAGQFEQKQIQIKSKAKRTELTTLHSLESDPNHDWVDKTSNGKTN